MNYDIFTTDDFIKDEVFQQWVFSPDEKSNSFWKCFISQNAHKQNEIEEARQFLLVFNCKDKEVLDSKIANLKKRIDTALDSPDNVVRDYNTEPRLSGGSKRIPRIKVYAMAASISIFLVYTFLFFYVNREGKLLATGSYELITQKGQRSLITLYDGTKVWLNADSQLKYPESFAGKKSREVYLEGEAYFDVAENKDQPFIVTTSDLKVKVLGTAFNIRSYKKDDIIETTLIRGEVKVESTGKQSKEITLRPNQKVVFEKHSRKLMLENQVETDKYTAWREGRLIFEDQPLSEIISALERWYNVTIRLEDTSSLDCHFSAKVDNKSLEEVLDLLKSSENIDYTVNGNEIVITGKLCKE